MIKTPELEMGRRDFIRLLGGASGALVTGCAENPFGPDDEGIIIEQAKRKLKRNVKDPILEERIDRTVYGFVSAAKFASRGTLNFNCKEKTGDFNGDGVVGLKDFFLFAEEFGKTGESVYDLDSNGKVDLGDFFRFADRFGYDIEVSSCGPTLSLPSELRFSQYVEGERRSNTFTLNLNDNSEGDIVSWDVDVLGDNEFRHHPDNAPLAEVLWYPYRAKALDLELDGDGNLVINPVANYNGDDHGIRELVVTGTNSEGESISSTLDVVVERNSGFDDLYDSIVTGIIWQQPPKSYNIWIGNHHKEGDNWLWDSNLSGLPTTQQEIANFERLARMAGDVSDYFKSLEIKNVNDYRDYLELFNNKSTENGAFFMNMRDFGSSSDTGNRFDFGTGQLDLSEVAIMPDDDFLTYMHEFFAHGMGMSHGGVFLNKHRTDTVFHGDFSDDKNNSTERLPTRDEAIINSYYELRQIGDSVLSYVF